MNCNDKVEIDNKKMFYIGNIIYTCCLFTCVLFGTFLRIPFEIIIVMLLVLIALYGMVMSKIDGDFEIIRNRNLLICAGVTKIIITIGVIFESTLWGTDGFNHKYDAYYYLVIIPLFIVQMIDTHVFIKNIYSKVNRNFIIFESMVTYVLFAILDNSVWGFFLIIPLLTVLTQCDELKKVKIVGICTCITVIIASYTQLHFFVSNSERKVGLFELIEYILNGKLSNYSKNITIKYISIIFLVILHFLAVLKVIKVVKKSNSYRMEKINEEEKKVRNIIDNILEADGTIDSNVQNILINMTQLNESNDENKINLEQLVHDMNIAMNQIYSQTENIKKISDLINEFAGDVEGIYTVTHKTFSELERNRRDFKKLKANSELMNENNKEARKIVEEFVNNVEIVKKIVKGIENISEEINLVSINASIKSSRVGDAGEGFVVLSKKIYDLAEETNAMTANIKASIRELESFTSNIKDTIDDVVSSVDENKEILQASIFEFENMEEYMINMREDIDVIDEMVREIKEFKETIEEKTLLFNKSNRIMIEHTEHSKELNDKNSGFEKDIYDLVKNIALSCDNLNKICQE